MKNKLNSEFYNRHCVLVAKALIGKELVVGEFKGIITETEAYREKDDEASHAFKGISKRNAPMFGPAGYTYIYLIYGLYHCLNIVTEQEGKASAVLIRGLLLADNTHLNGPGKICRHLGLNLTHNGIYLVDNDSFYVTEGIKKKAILTTPRIGIKKAIDKPWRFLLNLNPSKK